MMWDGRGRHEKAGKNVVSNAAYGQLPWMPVCVRHHYPGLPDIKYPGDRAKQSKRYRKTG